MLVPVVLVLSYSYNTALKGEFACAVLLMLLTYYDITSIVQKVVLF